MPLTQEQIQNYIGKVGGESEGEHWVTLCPTCMHPNKKLYIRQADGLYNCFHCNDVKFGDFEVVDEIDAFIPRASYQPKETNINEQLVNQYKNNLLNDTHARHVGFNYLIQQRHLSHDTILKFNMGFSLEENAIAIPGYDSSGALRTITYRYLQGEQRYKTLGTKGMFCTTTKPEGTCCILFEGEIDAITSWELEPSLPAYATQGKSVLKPELVQELSRYEIIYICFDAGTDAEVAKLGEVLGKHRCKRVVLPHEMDLNALMQYPHEVKRIFNKCLQDAQYLQPPLVVSIGSRITSCLDYFKGNEYLSKSTGYPALDDITGGVRPGELYIITGDSGLGKSTLMTSLALNIAVAGMRTNVCSLELPFESHIAPKLVSFILNRNIHIEPKVSIEEYHAVLDWLSNWNRLNIVNRVGSLNKNLIKPVLDSIYQMGYKCIVLDHLQFLVDKEENDEINSVVRILVDFLKEHMDFTIFLVAHARKPLRDFKTGGSKKLGMHDLKGSASLYQEPDNVWILNKDDTTNVVDLTVGKLRADKTSIAAGGRVVVYFNKNDFNCTIVPG